MNNFIFKKRYVEWVKILRESVIDIVYKIYSAQKYSYNYGKIVYA